jgi:hypothetical protein
MLVGPGAAELVVPGSRSVLELGHLSTDDAPRMAARADLLGAGAAIPYLVAGSPVAPERCDMPGICSRIWPGRSV